MLMSQTYALSMFFRPAACPPCDIRAELFTIYVTISFVDSRYYAMRRILALPQATPWLLSFRAA